MASAKILTPVRVGLLTVVAVVALVLGVTAVTKGGLSPKESYLVFAIFDDASGLRSKTRVQIAGIEVGAIERIELIGNKAKVTLRIRNDIVLFSDARIRKTSEGFIGDMTLDVAPGGQPPRIPPGGEIENVISAGDMEQVFQTLGDVTKDIQAVTASLRDVLAGEDTTGSLQRIIAEVGELTASVNTTIESSAGRLDAILANVEDISAQARDIATEEEATVQRILDNTEVLTRELTRTARDAQRVLTEVEGILGTSEGSLQEGVADLRQSLKKFNDTLGQVEAIAARVGEGEGTVGRLLTDDALIRDVEDAVGDVSDLVGRLTQLQIEMDLRSDIQVERESSREQVLARIKPSEDKWYEVGVVAPREDPQVSTVTTFDPGGVRRDTLRVEDAADDIEFNAMLARRWRFEGGSVTGRLGLIETTGGAAADVGLLDDHLGLTVEVFDFGDRYRSWPRLRAFAQINFLQNLFVYGGVDDALNGSWDLPASLQDAPEFETAPRDYFLGAGLRFTDDDLKSLILTVGAPSP